MGKFWIIVDAFVIIGSLVTAILFAIRKVRLKIVNSPYGQELAKKMIPDRDIEILYRFRKKFDEFRAPRYLKSLEKSRALRLEDQLDLVDLLSNCCSKSIQLREKVSREELLALLKSVLSDVFLNFAQEIKAQDLPAKDVGMGQRIIAVQRWNNFANVQFKWEERDDLDIMIVYCDCLYDALFEDLKFYTDNSIDYFESIVNFPGVYLKLFTNDWPQRIVNSDYYQQLVDKELKNFAKTAEFSENLIEYLRRKHPKETKANIIGLSDSIAFNQIIEKLLTCDIKREDISNEVVLAYNRFTDLLAKQ